MSYLPQRPPTLEAALRDVYARGRDARLAAADRLGEAPPEQREVARQGLLHLLGDRTLSIQAAALVSLGSVGNAEDLQRVLPFLEHPDPTLRQSAVVSAVTLGGKAAADALSDALDSPHADLRYQALARATELDTLTLARVFPLLRDEDAEVRAQAASTAAQLALSAADPEPAAEQIAQLLKDRSLSTRVQAALALASLGDSRAQSILCEALEEPDYAISAALSLATIGAADARQALWAKASRWLCPLLLKAACGASLARLGDERGLAVLRGVLQAYRPDGRSFAVELIGEFGVVELLDDVAALQERPRGSDPAAIEATLHSLRAAARSPSTRL